MDPIGAIFASFLDVISTPITQRYSDVMGTKLQDMYCTAAVSYQPTVASIGWSSDTSLLDEARTECNLAIAAFVGNPDPEARLRKKVACDKYDAFEDR